MTQTTGNEFNKSRCERCGGALGVRRDRSCAWDAHDQKWVDACYSCKRQIHMNNSLPAPRKTFTEFRAVCGERVDIPVTRRPANALVMECAKPSDRCRLKTPEHWGDVDYRGVRWICSGGDPLVFGYCEIPCPIFSQ